MKNLILALMLLSPITSHADDQTGGTISCSLDGQVDFTLVIGTRNALGEGSHVTVVANGVLHTVIDSVVTKVNSVPGSLSLELTTLNDAGQVDEKSGLATLEVRLDQDGHTPTTALLKLLKFPPRKGPIRFQPEYPLTECSGKL